MDNKTNNVITYLKWRGDLSFEQDSFNEVDGFILSQITFLDFSEIIKDKPMLLKEALKKFFEDNPKDNLKLGLIIPKYIVEFLYSLIKVKRYENILISNYVEKYDKVRKEQFAALTFHIDKKYLVVAYKGTDDTLVGWEENFNMIISFPIAAQISALEYLNKIASENKHSHFVVLGHSKGGNLAMYASMHINEGIQKHIDKVYNYDGPGFEKDDLNLKLYEKIKSKITTILPEHSSIGMIFNQLGKVKAVKTNAKGLFQHDGLTWYVERNRFEKTKLSDNSIKFSKALNAMVEQLSEEDRKSFCSSLEKYIETNGVKTLSELKNTKKGLLNAIKIFTKKDRILFIQLLRIMVKYHMI